MTVGKNGVCGCGKCGRWFNLRKLDAALRANAVVQAALEIFGGVTTISSVVCPHCGAENSVE